MGHYRAEMVCNECDNYICTCKTKVEEDYSNVFVVDDYKVITGAEYIAKNKQSFGYYVKYLGLKKFDSAKKAEVYLRNKLLDDIVAANDELKRLQCIMQDLPKL